MSFAKFFKKIDKSPIDKNEEIYEEKRYKEKDYKEKEYKDDTNDLEDRYKSKDSYQKEKDRESDRHNDKDDRESDRHNDKDDRDYDRYDDRDERDDRYNDDYREERDNREERDDKEYRRNREEKYIYYKDTSLKNMDSFFYKKNIQIMKIFKMKNRCIFILVLIVQLGKCVLIYVDPSKYEIECQNYNSVTSRENIHDIDLYRINYKDIHQLCDCYPELMKQKQEHRINIENEKNKIYLLHFEQICIQLNNFKKIVSSSKSKLGILTEFSISFINNENDIELFTIVDTNPEKFSKMKTYLVYDLNTFMNNIETINFEIERLIPSFIDELNKDDKILKKQIENNSTINNINSIKQLLDKLENKKNSLHKDSLKLEDMFKIAKKNLSQAQNKRDNVQQRYGLEKLKNVKQETMYFMMDVEDEYNNILSHSLNMMNLIDKQCRTINEYIEYIKKYCEFN